MVETNEKACNEVLVLLKMLPEAELKKIPETEIKFLEEHRDVNYNFSVNPEVPINEVNISKSKQEGDEGMAYTAIQEVEKIIENVKTDLQGLIQATADFIVKINGNFEDTDQRCAEQIKGEVK